MTRAVAELKTTSKKSIKHSFVPAMTAMSIALSSMPLAFAGPGDVNSTNVGTVVQGGTYYNTSDSKTTFVAQNGSLWVQQGTIVRGLEVNQSNALTGNGGNMHFSAPGGVVRVDGTVNVSGLLGHGYTTANGGRVTVDAAMLYQNGQILADGYNGGLMQFNVGSAVFTENSLTAARGIGGGGGSIVVNASNIVDIQKNTHGPNVAILDASGRYMGDVNSDLISVQGAVVNVNGIVRANGQVVADGSIVHLYNEIAMAPNGDTASPTIPEFLRPEEGTLMTTGSDGGTIRVLSHGNISNTEVCNATCVLNKAVEDNVIDNNLRTTLLTRLNNIQTFRNGRVVVGMNGVIEANGSSVSIAKPPLFGDVPGFSRVDKGYGYYERLFNEDGPIGLLVEFFNPSLPANFSSGGDGGMITLMAPANVNFQEGSRVSASGGAGYQRTLAVTPYRAFDGGDGGGIAISSGNKIVMYGDLEARGGDGYQGAWGELRGGLGGNGGLIVLSNQNATVNHGTSIDLSNGASGTLAFINALNHPDKIPNGGLLVIAGPSNPSNLSNVRMYQGPAVPFANKYGTVALPNPHKAASIAQLTPSDPAIKPHLNRTQNDELIVAGQDNRTLILLSSSDRSLLSSKVENANVRNAAAEYQRRGAQALIAGHGDEITSLQISNQWDGQRLRLDHPDQLKEGSLFSGGGDWNLRSLLVLNSGNNSVIRNNATWSVGASDDGSGINQAGGLIAMRSTGSIVNGGTLQTYGPDVDGNINLSSSESVVNRGDIIGSGDSDVGAGIVLKAGRDIYNGRFATIDASAHSVGGRIVASAFNNVMNQGSMLSNASDEGSLGGSILTNAGNLNLNFGLMSANSSGADGRGGFILMHGRNLASNIDISDFFGLGTMQALGTGNNGIGGRLFLTSGGLTGGNQQDTVGASDTVNDAVSILLAQTLLKGFSTTQNTPPVTVLQIAIDMTKQGSAINLGHMDTRGDQSAGSIFLIGNGQAGIGNNSSLNGVTISYDNIMQSANPAFNFQQVLKAIGNNNANVNMIAGFVDGFSATDAVFARNLPDHGANPPGSGGVGPNNGYTFPLNFTLAQGDGNNENGGNNNFGTQQFDLVDLDALYQEARFKANDRLPSPLLGMLLNFNQPTLFLAKGYESVTQQILKLALEQYNTILAMSSQNTPAQRQANAQNTVQQYLQEAGIDSEIAKELLVKIQNGEISVDDPVVQMLQSIADASI